MTTIELQRADAPGGWMAVDVEVLRGEDLEDTARRVASDAVHAGLADGGTKDDAGALAAAAVLKVVDLWGGLA